MTDAAGTRTFAYNEYDELISDSLSADNVNHLITETMDSYGRSTGYTYARGGSVQQTVSYSYGTDGRLSTAAFTHGGEAKQFSYAYLPGTHLLQTLTMPNGMTLTQQYEQQRNLLTAMLYKRGETSVVERFYSYDTLGRPLTRTENRQGGTRNDAFTHNDRSELTNATLGTANYAYAYDNIGNRKSAQENAEEATNYDANALNQYTAVGSFAPTFDADGNQTLVQTSTGIWNVTYNAENRPTEFTRENADGTTTKVTCTYDYMGRRATKKVETIATDGTATLTLHQRYLYRGYLQVACCDLTRDTHPCLWLITWDPTQPTATRPLAIQKDATWYTYGWDLTKNICEVFGADGLIKTAYRYTPYGAVTAEGNVSQPIQWSSEYYDDGELGLVYYNYRHYNPEEGRWFGRDKVDSIEADSNTYKYVYNAPEALVDNLGLQARIPSIGGPSCHVYSGTCGYTGENNNEIRDLSFVAAGAGLGATFASNTSMAYTVRAALCDIIHKIYSRASKHRPTCKKALTKREYEAGIKALQTEVSFRSLYLMLRCDYYLEGSKKSKIGSVGKQRNHVDQLIKKTAALVNCRNRKLNCLK